MKKIYLLSCLFIGFAKLSAQNMNGFAFNATTPQGNLKSSGYGTGGGLSFEHYWKPTPKLSTGKISTRIWYALDLQCLGYSKKIERVNMPTPASDLGYVYFENTSLGFSIGPKFLFNTGTRVTPYLSAFAGMRLFGTHRHNTLYDESKTSELKEKDITVYSALRPQAGLSGGVMLRLARRTYFDFSLSYAAGPGVSFVNLYDAWKEEDGTIRYRMDKSGSTGLLTTKIGLVFCNCR